jgi:hypothetical protein
MTKKRQSKLDFESSMGKDDFGLIIGKNGELKGLFVPDSLDEELDFMPEAIVAILEDVYGLDMGDEATIH